MAGNEKALKDLHEVLAVTRAMVVTSELDELLELIIARTLDLLEVERATLFLYDRERNELVSRIATGVKELRVPADRGICGETVTRNATILVQDAYSDKRFNPEVDRQTGFRTRNIMSIPLRDYSGELEGVLQVLNKKTGDFTDYDVTLAETLGAQAGVALQRARLINHFLEKQKMQRAMEIARDIQQGLLPKEAPCVDGFDIAGMTQPADETGGDLYDFIPLHDGAYAAVVADATGHGIGPALVVAETRAMLRTSANLGGGEKLDITSILEAANKMLSADLEGSFVTCFFGVLDARRAVLDYASAGHGPMLFYRAADDSFAEVPATSLPLGIMDFTEYEQIAEFKFTPGDMAVITTDGIFEALSPQGEMFGVERMQRIIRENKHRPSREIMDCLCSATEEFTAGAPQADDITAIIIKCES